MRVGIVRSLGYVPGMTPADLARPLSAPARAVTLVASIALAAFPGSLLAQDDTVGNERSGGSLGGLSAALERPILISRDLTVREGDNMLTIARREFGSARFARPLAEFNGVADIRAPLVLGDVIRVPIQVPARGETARVAFVKGEVSRAGLPLDADADIAEGDIIVTGPTGFVSIEFSSGTVINLQPETEATIVRLSCFERDDSCRIHIESDGGEIGSDVEKRDGQPVDFRITAPFASAAVRGTRFDTVVENGSLRAAVMSGEVIITSWGGSVTLTEGFGVATVEGEPPGEPRPLLRAPVFRTTPIRIAAGDALAWFALTDAERYDASFSRDEAGREPVAKWGAVETRLELDEGLLEPGDYHLSLRGVDAADLPGFESTVRIGVADIDETIAPVAVTITREGPEFLVEVVDPPADAPGFEIQVDTDDTLADPLSIDVAATGRAVIRIEADTLFARARVLVDPFLVSAFGPVASTDD